MVEALGKRSLLGIGRNVMEHFDHGHDLEWTIWPGVSDGATLKGNAPVRKRLAKRAMSVSG